MAYRTECSNKAVCGVEWKGATPVFHGVKCPRSNCNGTLASAEFDPGRLPYEWAMSAVHNNQFVNDGPDTSPARKDAALRLARATEDAALAENPDGEEFNFMTRVSRFWADFPFPVRNW